MFNFDFLENGLGIISPPHLIPWLLLLLEILGSMCIVVVSFSGCDFISYEINQIFLIKLFSYMTKKKSRRNIKYLEIKKSFWGKIKNIFHHY